MRARPRTELERYDEAEPPVDDAGLDGTEAELATVSFPATAAEVVDVVGERRVTAGQETYGIDKLLPETKVETFDDPAVVRSRIQRPTLGTAMKRIVEASGTIPNGEFSASQYDAYEKTIRALQTVDTIDDGSVEAITDWIVERIEAKGKLPGSREVRRQGAKITRDSGCGVRDDEWLGT